MDALIYVGGVDTIEMKILDGAKINEGSAFVFQATTLTATGKECVYGGTANKGHQVVWFIHSFIYLYTAHVHQCILWVLHEDTVLKRIVVIMILLKTYRHHTTRRSSSCLDETLSTFMVYLPTEIDSISFFEFHTYAAISGGHFVGFYYYDSSTSAQAIHIYPQIVAYGVKVQPNGVLASLQDIIFNLNRFISLSLAKFSYQEI